MKQKTKDRLDRIEKAIRELTLSVEEIKLSMHPTFHIDVEDTTSTNKTKDREKAARKAAAKLPRHRPE